MYGHVFHVYMKMFGTNGIRGIANDFFLNCNNSAKIGMAIASVLGRKNIAMEIDTRTSSDMLRSAVSSGNLNLSKYLTVHFKDDMFQVVSTMTTTLCLDKGNLNLMTPGPTLAG